MEPIFFASPAEFREWLERNHQLETEVLVGFHKKATKRPTMTWSESVDEALCFGWIDGVRRSHGPDAYTIRFTPRRPNSTWSKINVAKVAELTDRGRMRPAGLAAFERRRDDNTAVYSYEQANAQLPADYDAELRANRQAAAWFDAQPPGYRRTAVRWVLSAKREQTRRSRLNTLIADAAAGRKVKPLRRPGE